MHYSGLGGGVSSLPFAAMMSPEPTDDEDDDKRSRQREAVFLRPPKRQKQVVNDDSVATCEEIRLRLLKQECASSRVNDHHIADIVLGS